MPRDISDSSGDEDVTPEAQKKRILYECPEDFTATSYTPCLGAQGSTVFDGNKELWLIKAPSNFDSRRLSGMKLPLMGLQSVQTADPGTTGAAQQQILSILGRRSTPTTGFRLLTTDPKRLDAHLCAPAFSGMLNISESYGDCSSNQGPIPVPAAPAPCLPDGLRQRFFPFGSGRPVITTTPMEEEGPEEASAPTHLPRTAYTTAVDSAIPPAAVMVKQEKEQETPRKRKKDKRVKMEVGEAAVPEPAPEPVAFPLPVVVKVERPDLGTQASEERKEKKKKKKKDKEKERERDGEAEVETVVVKTERVGDAYVVIKQEPGEPAPKKKKKKKSKTDE
ncbi:CD3e molecule, epsilon associated protein [Engraulis encrasicolus]|uniref:CD3e molecule, epsilon associated protein n=1 Tax=Engraulis encrasicolus TaxID=184585 RepID=UPI002FD26EA7